MTTLLGRLNPFTSGETRRLAALFGVVYFAQGMWYLPNQTITISFKDQGLTAGGVATFFMITTLPWLVKPLYGLLSDFVPLFGLRRKSYFLLAASLAAGAGFTLALVAPHTWLWLAALVTLMGLGLAFTDVLADALMVENGRPRGLTGAFQSVQWAAIYAAAILVGIGGGALAERRDLHVAFLLAACFPVVSLTMALMFVQEPAAAAGREAFRARLASLREAVRERDVWVVAGFILFWTFSPSYGTPLLYYQTDTLGFRQQFIGNLAALSSAASIVGAVVYAPLSRRLPLRRLIVLAIGLATVSTLSYLLYRGPVSAVVIDVVYGCTAMIAQLAFLDLAAKACPRRVEGTFFALIMSVYNGGTQGSQVVGGYLYDWLGLRPLVLISATLTAVTWALVPLVRFERIEAQARASAA